MISLCKADAVPVLFVGPVSNLRDCPPFKMELPSTLPSAEKAHFNQLWADAIQANAEGRSKDAEAHLTDALEVDPEHAGAHFFLGTLLLARGDATRAETHLVAARDCDVCPLRAPTAIHREVQEICDRENIGYIDAQAIFSALSDHGIIGDSWLVDHIHPNVEGHQLLGERIAEKAFALNWLDVDTDDWQNRRTEAYRAYLSTIGEEYFHRAKQRLEGLQLWTQGRAKKIAPTSP